MKRAEPGRNLLRGALGGLLAASCCLLPLAAIAGGLGAFAGLNQAPRFRPLFIAAGLVLVVVLNLRLWRTRSWSSKRLMIALGYGFTSYLVILTLFTYLLTPAITQIALGKTHDMSTMGASSQTKPVYRQVTLKVDGLTCGSCSAIVKGYITRVPGVFSAEIDFNTKKAVVLYDSSRTTAPLIAQAVTGQRAAGTTYTASVESDRPIDR